MNYNFDEIIDRKHSNSLSYDGWKEYLFGEYGDHAFPYNNDELIRMWVADMDFSTPPEILEAIKLRLHKKILGYTILDDDYYTILHSWFKKRYEWEVNLDHMVISPGIIPALNRLTGLLTGKGENILINTPSYTPFKTAGHIHNRKVFYSDLVLNEGRYEINFDDLIHQLSDKQRNIKLFIFCNPHNPTGRVWTEKELRRIGEICLERDVWIISDEIHCDLLRKNSKHIPLARLFPKEDKIITCTALSKTFNLAGNLMSHIFIPNETIRSEWMKLFFDLLSPLSVEAVKAAYGKCENWLEQLKTYLDNNFHYLEQQLKEHLPRIKFIIPEATYLAWIDISAYIEDIQVKSLSLYFAREAGVLLEDAGMFVANGQGHIRLNLACPRSALAKGLKRIIHTLKATD